MHIISSNIAECGPVYVSHKMSHVKTLCTLVIQDIWHKLKCRMKTDYVLIIMFRELLKAGVSLAST